MTRELAFWDSSALVPLCVRQAATPRATTFYQKYDPIVWWATPVEIASALARLARMGQLNLSQRTKALKLAGDLALAWSVVQPSEALRANAMQLVERHDLRAADALQLAAALEWCGHQTKTYAFLTGDQRLQEAATLQGFDVYPV